MPNWCATSLTTASAWLGVAVDQEHLMSGRGERLQQKHPQVWHEILRHAVVGAIEEDLHGGAGHREFGLCAGSSVIQLHRRVVRFPNFYLEGP